MKKMPYIDPERYADAYGLDGIERVQLRTLWHKLLKNMGTLLEKYGGRKVDIPDVPDIPELNIDISQDVQDAYDAMYESLNDAIRQLLAD